MSIGQNGVSSAAPTPKVITFVQDYISPVNALFILPITIAAVLDILLPFRRLLFSASGSIASALVLGAEAAVGGRAVGQK